MFEKLELGLKPRAALEIDESFFQDFRKWADRRTGPPATGASPEAQKEIILATHTYHT